MEYGIVCLHSSINDIDIVTNDEFDVNSLIIDLIERGYLKEINLLTAFKVSRNDIQIIHGLLKQSFDNLSWRLQKIKVKNMLSSIPCENITEEIKRGIREFKENSMRVKLDITNGLYCKVSHGLGYVDFSSNIRGIPENDPFYEYYLRRKAKEKELNKIFENNGGWIYADTIKELFLELAFIADRRGYEYEYRQNMELLCSAWVVTDWERSEFSKALYATERERILVYSANFSGIEQYWKQSSMSYGYKAKDLRDWWSYAIEHKIKYLSGNMNKLIYLSKIDCSRQDEVLETETC